MSIMRSVGGEASFARTVEPEPEDELFSTSLVASRPLGRARWRGFGAPVSLAVHLLVLAAVVLVPIFVPGTLPDQRDYIRALLYDPPPPPPPPPLRGSSLRPEPAKPEPPKPVVEEPAKQEFTAPIETPQPRDDRLEPEQGVRPDDQAGSETGSDLGDPLGMEGGVLGGQVGGVPGGVLGGTLGGTGTGPVTDYDSPPRLVKQTKPQYPQEAFIKKIEGTVLVEFLIDSSGRVVRARVIQSVPLLDAAALQTVYQWMFQPAVKHGRPVATIARAPVHFRIY
jgi:periplasmic protein TonB